MQIRKGPPSLNGQYFTDNQHGEEVPGPDFSLHLALQKVPLWHQQPYMTVLRMKERTGFWMYGKPELEEKEKECRNESGGKERTLQKY